MEFRKDHYFVHKRPQLYNVLSQVNQAHNLTHISSIAILI
jgi:TFIIF-interacting CTD phosphatase-like protein